MKTHYFLFCILIFCTFSSFDTSKACEYAGSNIDYIKSQTQKAIDSEDINTSRYFAYKALNAIVKSKKSLDACGCDYAVKSINEGLDNLKMATKVSSLSGTRILLNRALENALGSLEALETHDELHGSKYDSDVLAMNTTETEKEKAFLSQPVGKELESKIDRSLIKYENSLYEVVATLECKEAYAYARKIYDHCEQQLLNSELSEGKKYYNLRTKEITAKAIEQLDACSQ